ncbi:uncharacterized protein LOC116338888 [Contarinia nasturtii]|uniref:uncharacterized protein LOC116338888 n=1 Tax=Contarinia nasturtii TaxID=265458 RepID=UPI0012D40A10|nr:uncharacterized protein LOC116338888 [Contarinia nasturtii]
MAKSTDGNLTKNRTHIDDISDNFALAIDNIWYTLIELETSLHERIIVSMKLFNDTIRTIIENFNDKSNETFHIRSACDTYFQSYDDGYNDANNDPNNKTTQKRHMNIIDQKLDLMCTRANKWLEKIIEQYELDEYNRNRAKIMEISDFIDAERQTFSQLKDNLIAKYELQALF